MSAVGILLQNCKSVPLQCVFCSSSDGKSDSSRQKAVTELALGRMPCLSLGVAGDLFPVPPVPHATDQVTTNYSVPEVMSELDGLVSWCEPHAHN